MKNGKLNKRELLEKRAKQLAHKIDDTTALFIKYMVQVIRTKEDAALEQQAIKTFFNDQEWIALKQLEDVAKKYEANLFKTENTESGA